LSFSLYSGSLPAGLSLDTTTGIVSGTPTAATTTTFTIEADDTFSTGAFFDRATYTLTSKYNILISNPANFSQTSANVGSVGLSVDSFTNSNTGSAGYYFSNDTNGTNSGWIQTNAWTNTNLSCGSNYSYSVKYRNPDAAETSALSLSASTNTCQTSAGVGASVNNSALAPAATSTITVSTISTATIPTIPTTSVSLQSQIDALQAQVKELLLQLSQLSLSNSISNFNFTKPLYFGLFNDDVKNLQTCLKMNLITGYFGPLTKKAVQNFQIKYNLSSQADSAFGYVGPKTRAKLNELFK